MMSIIATSFTEYILVYFHSGSMSGDDIEANKAMCSYCFDVLTAHFDNVNVNDLPKLDDSNSVSVGGMFVTLYKKDSKDEKQLRGCIGRLSELLLNEISNYVLMSAFKDSRFPPLSKEELPYLEVAVSLLIKYERANNYLDWEVGIHGIIIEFYVGSKRYSGTFLPDVSSEQGWTREDTVRALIRKAGYRGKVSIPLLESLSVTRYQSSKNSLSYSDHVEVRKSSEVSST